MDITEKFDQVLDNPDSVTPEERRAIIEQYISERESDIAEVKESIDKYKEITAKLQAMVDEQEAIIAAVKAKAPISKVNRSVN